MNVLCKEDCGKLKGVSHVDLFYFYSLINLIDLNFNPIIKSQ